MEILGLLVGFDTGAIGTNKKMPFLSLFHRAAA